MLRLSVCKHLFIVILHSVNLSVSAQSSIWSKVAIIVNSIIIIIVVVVNNTIVLSRIATTIVSFSHQRYKMHNCLTCHSAWCGRWCFDRHWNVMSCRICGGRVCDGRYCRSGACHCLRFRCLHRDVIVHVFAEATFPFDGTSALKVVHPVFARASVSTQTFRCAFVHVNLAIPTDESHRTYARVISEHVVTCRIVLACVVVAVVFVREAFLADPAWGTLAFEICSSPPTNGVYAARILCARIWK